MPIPPLPTRSRITYRPIERPRSTGATARAGGCGRSTTVAPVAVGASESRRSLEPTTVHHRREPPRRAEYRWRGRLKTTRHLSYPGRMGVRPFVCSSIVALVVVGAATRAHAQGILQNTYDRGSWPEQYEQRTIVLPEQMWQLEVDAGVQAIDVGVPDSSLTAFALTPSVAYGINRNVTIGASQISTISVSS